MSKDVTLTIDGVSVTVPEGTTVLDAALQAGIDIPHLCYDPALGLTPTGSCRLCLVEVEGGRGPVASCVLPAAAGMVVRTDSEALREHRRLVIDLLLSNHPHDCMTCETAGNCALQRYAYLLSVKDSEYRGESVWPDPVQDGPAIVFDESKCILCGRCVQVCQEVQVTGAVDFIGRGFDTHVGLPFGLPREQSVCVECGNCIDVCPTGALYYAGGQRKGREWEGESVTTVCPYCGCGCQMELRIVGGEIAEIRGLPGPGATRGLLCVKGRFGFDFIGHEDRLKQPLIRRDGKLVPASWEEALDTIARRLNEIKAEHGPDAIGGLASAKCTNEENYLLQKFVRAVIGTNNVDHCARLCHASTVAGLARAFGSGAMTNSIEDLPEADVVFVIGSNTTECHPIIGAVIKRAVKEGKSRLIVADPRAIELTEYADIHLQQKPGTDVALVNALARAILHEKLEDREFIAQRTEGFEEFREAVEPYTPELAEQITGVPAEEIVRAARLYGSAETACIIYSMGITQHTTGTDNVLALANLAMVTGNIGRPGTGVNPLRGQNNVQGACDVGALPDVYPGYQRVADEAVRAKFERAWGTSLPSGPGLTVVEMVNAAREPHPPSPLPVNGEGDSGRGRIRALYIMGENPMLSDPDVNHVEEGLKNLEFLAVQDIFLTETAQLADVVLPAAAFAEKEGTFTSTERRVQLICKAVEPPGEARTDWEILCDLATRMGYPMSYPNVAAIEDEIAGVTPIYGGIVYERLKPHLPSPLPVHREGGTNGLQWPCPDRSHPGTPILHREKFTRGLGKFHAVEFIAARELPDDEYPFVLSTGRILQHYHTGTMTRRSEVLDKLVSVGAIEISPADAAQLGVAEGDMVEVESRRGKIEIAARVSERVAAGTLFLAFHFREAPANRLTIAALDPVAKIPEFKVCAVKVRAARTAVP